MYVAADMSRWTGRVDAEGEQSRRWHQCVEAWQPQAAPGVALLGFASDEGVRRNQGRTGAADGPAAIRKALSGLPWHGNRPRWDAGDIVCTDGALEQAQEAAADTVARLLECGQFPVVLGGGHEVAWATFSGLSRFLLSRVDPESGGGRPARLPRVGILNFDAHFDLRQAGQATSGTPFAQIADWCAAQGWPFRYCCLGVAETGNTPALYDTARRLGVEWVADDAMTGWNLPDITRRLDAFMADCDVLYLTIDLDVFPAGQAPGVSAPAACGVAVPVVEALIDHIRATGRLRVADIAEMNPRLDQDGHTARLAARLVHRLSR